MVRSLAKDIQSFYPDINYNLKVEENIIIKGDYVLINLLLESLLKNAFKFSVKASNPSIEFFKTEKDGLSVFCIKDNGAGFIGQNDEKLFTPFKRFHSDYEFDGIGIGLAIAKKIIDKHKGTIWADSQPGKGAAFYFTLNV
jgi:light-regulated signal transduction histidine kinase (bacteriophytochrome)